MYFIQMILIKFRHIKGAVVAAPSVFAYSKINISQAPDIRHLACQQSQT